LQALAGACGIDTRDLLPKTLMDLLPEPPLDERSPGF
jgi:hypothetical protein